MELNIQEILYLGIEAEYEDVMMELQQMIAGGEDRPNPIHRIKLKEIDIPKFSGNLDGWLTFRNLFRNRIHNDKSYTAEDKMLYLKTLTIGEAGKVIAHLQVDEARYTDAWDLLHQRYDNTRILARKDLDMLLNLPNITSESSQMLKGMHDNVRECVYALKSLDIDTNGSGWNALVVHILVKKLDKHTIQLYEQSIKNPKEMQQQHDLLNFVETRLQTLEAVSKE